MSDHNDIPIDYEKVYQILEEIQASVEEYRGLLAQGPPRAGVVYIDPPLPPMVPDSEGTVGRRYPYVPSERDRARWIARDQVAEPLRWLRPEVDVPRPKIEIRSDGDWRLRADAMILDDPNGRPSTKEERSGALRPFADLVPPDLHLTGYTGACLGITDVSVGDHTSGCGCPKCSIERDLTHEEKIREWGRNVREYERAGHTVCCPRCTPKLTEADRLCPRCIDLFAPEACCGDDADAITELWRNKGIGQCAECKGALSGCVDPEHGINDPVEDKVSVCANCKCRILGTGAQGAELRALWEARDE